MIGRTVRVWVGVVCLLLNFGISAGAQSVSPTNVPTAVPHLIKFNGTLHNLAGKPVTGPVDVTFSLYSNETSGPALWFETQTVQADSLGNYTVLLGAMTPSGVPIELFAEGEARWLGVQVTNLPEQPRVLLVSVPYALKAGDAETLGGKPASAFMPASQADSAASAAATAGTLSGLVQAHALTSTRGATTPQAITPGGAANYIAGYSSDGTTLGASTIFQDPTTNLIGIGTNTPAFGLDLASNVFGVGTKTARPGYGGTMRFRDDTGTVRWSFGIPGSAGATDFFMYNNANGHAPVYIQAGAPSYELYLHASGRVGMGTTAPAFPLDVNGNVIGVGPTAAKPGYGGTVRFRDDTGTVRWAIGIPGSAGATDFILSNLTTSRAPLYIQSGAPSNALYLNSSGNVGVGTASPAHKLDVVGDINSNSTLTGSQFVSTVGTGTPPLSVASTTQIPNLNASLLGGFDASAFAPAAGASAYVAKSGDTMTGPLNLPADDLNVGGSELATSGGFVGVGTASPSARLTVVSSGSDRGLQLAGPGGNIVIQPNSPYAIGGYQVISFNGYSDTGGFRRFNPQVNSWHILVDQDCFGFYSGSCIGYNDSFAIGTFDGSTFKTFLAAGPNGVVEIGVQYPPPPSLATNTGSGLVIAGSTPTLRFQTPSPVGPAWEWQTNGATGATSLVYATLMPGTTTLTVLPTGKVGIGTTTPTTTLQVGGGDMSTTAAGAGVIVKSPDGSKCARIGIDNTGALVATPVTCP